MDQTDTDTLALVADTQEPVTQADPTFPADPDPPVEGDEGQPAEPEVEEVEFEGKKYTLPKEIKPALLRQADYTRKTQEVAEIRRAAEAERQAVEQEAKVREELSSELMQQKWVDDRLQYLSTIDPYQLDDANRQAYMLEQMQLTQAKAGLGERINSRRSELETKAQQEIAKQLRHAVDELAKPDERYGWPGSYDKAKAEALTNLARDLGLDESDFVAFRKPGHIKMAHLAKIGLDYLTKQRQQLVRQEATTAARVPTSRASHTSDPSKMNMDQYVAARKAGRVK